MRPRVTLHFAQSLDGKIDDPSAPASLRLSNAEGLAAAHRARARHDAVLIGVNTLLRDDPQLDVRHVAGPNPHRVVLDSRLRTPPASRIFDGRHGESVYVVTDEATRETTAAASLVASGATLIHCPSSARHTLDLHHALHELRAAGIERLLVEGGHAVLTAFMAARCVDVLEIEVCLSWVGRAGLPAFDEAEIGAFRLVDVSSTLIGGHMLVRARPVFSDEGGPSPTPGFA